MYQLQQTSAKQVILRNGSIHAPLATLKDEYGGISHIIEDDHCYVLVNGSENGEFGTVKHWHREAVKAIQGLLPPKPA